MKTRSKKDRRDQNREAQRKFKEINEDEGRRRIQFYVDVECIELIRSRAIEKGSKAVHLYKEAIEIYARSSPPESKVQTVVKELPTPVSAQTIKPVFGTSCTPLGSSPKSCAASSMSEARAKQRRAILESNNLSELRSERARSHRIVVTLRAKLPDDHPLARPKDLKGRGADVLTSRAPRMYATGDKAKNKEITKRACVAVKAQIQAWHLIEDKIREALEVSPSTGSNKSGR